MTSLISLLTFILGALFSLILANFAYTYRVTTALWREITALRANDLAHLIHRVDAIEQKSQRLHRGPRD